MDKALILITLEPLAERKVLNQLRRIEGVIEAEMLYGPYDAYAMIEAKNSGALHDLVMDKIRGIEGINSTMTCFIAD
jgi:DNA-binding Lrp family transcriptional regulator